MHKDIRDAIFDEIYKLAEEDEDVIVLTADADSFGLRKFKKNFPERFINVGVAEQNMITVAAGMALSNKKVFVCAIAPFVTLRCLEQIKVTICSMNLPVFIIGMGIGLSFDFDGPTHHSICDIGVMSNLPEISIYNPIDQLSGEYVVRESYIKKNPSYIRLDKGIFSSLYYSEEDLYNGCKLIKSFKDKKNMVISTGICSQYANLMERKASLIDIFRIKPFPRSKILKYISGYKNIITYEEHVKNSGIGSMMANIIVEEKLNINLYKISLPEVQIFKYGSRKYLHHMFGIDRESLECHIQTI